MSKKNSNQFNPNVLIFLCNWSGVADNDILILDKFSCTPLIQVKKIACSGSVEPARILEGFNQGNDGVLICACEEGTCHYIKGNERAKERVIKIQKILDILRIEKERLKLEYFSPSERGKFSTILTGFINQLISLGPINPGGKT